MACAIVTAGAGAPDALLAAARVREVNLRVAPAAVTTLVGAQAGWMDGEGASAALSAPAHLAFAPWPSSLLVPATRS